MHMKEIMSIACDVRTMHVKNTIQPSRLDQNDATSSKAKSSPPTGALNADATPVDVTCEM